ncbi:Mis6-domain-containing protein [Coniochaeta ligniaria NRRL 30616]|uniref:Mis6-domain-containing protein n=1 Tax=Coniochaeta ligniaria NRRL 30616 TaxID=1408157 RepID=A0A1J7IPY1_9PEZI|nr:Mis6-domain-containing protein [Coniochaeta ligniaria NRRL 30616]
MADRHETLIGDVEEASKLPAKRRAAAIKPTIERLTDSLYENGALPDDLVRLVGLVTHPRHLDQASLAAIVRNLYPTAKVPGDAILDVVGCLGHGELKPSLTIQGHLLRWLVMVYHVLEEPEALSRAYAVLFNLLDTAAIRPQLCHVLALITRRKHVRPFRIQAVLALSRQTGSDPALTGLLRVFKNYYPEIIVGEVTRGRAAAFKHPDPQWRSRLDEIQAEHRSRATVGDTGPRNGFRVNHLLSRQMKGRASSLPTVRTVHAQENSVTLEEIDNADSFVRNLEKFELPSQLVAVLADPLLQKLMILRPNNEASARVKNWVAACARDVKSGDAGAEVLLDVIEVLHDYVSATKSLPSVLLFHVLFTVWNGVDSQEAVLSALSYLPIADFSTLYQKTLQPLENCILKGTSETQLILLNFYTSLLRNWSITVFSTEDNLSPNVSSIADLIEHVHNLALTISQSSPSNTTAAHLAILDFYEVTATITAHPNILQSLRQAIPHPSLVYILHFSPSLAVFCRLCDVLATYKRGLGTIVSQTPELSELDKARLKVFNGFLMDICNCIWRVRAFSSSDKNAQGCHVAAPVVGALEAYAKMIDPDTPLESMFDVSHSPVLCAQSLECIRELEDIELAEKDGDLRERHGGPVTQKSLAALRNRGGLNLEWQEYRLAVINHLEERGFVGIPRLMYVTMKILMRSREQSGNGSVLERSNGSVLTLRY